MLCAVSTITLVRPSTLSHTTSQKLKPMPPTSCTIMQACLRNAVISEQPCVCMLRCAHLTWQWLQSTCRCEMKVCSTPGAVITLLASSLAQTAFTTLGGATTRVPPCCSNDAASSPPPSVLASLAEACCTTSVGVPLGKCGESIMKLSQSSGP